MRRVPRRASAPGRTVGGMRWAMPLNRRAVPVAGVARSMAGAGAVSDQVEQSEMAGLTESTGPVEPTGQPVAQRMEFPEATPEAGAAGRTETQPVETPAGDESEPKKHSGFHLFGKGGKGGKGGAKGASAEPLFHAGDSFMPGDGSVDQSVSDDIESMFARPFIPGTQRPSGENNENDENKD